MEINLRTLKPRNPAILLPIVFSSSGRVSKHELETFERTDEFKLSLITESRVLMNEERLSLKGVTGNVCKLN